MGSRQANGYFFTQQGVQWKQCQRDGVLRGINTRDGWNKVWKESMSRPLFSPAYSTPSKHLISFMRICSMSIPSPFRWSEGKTEATRRCINAGGEPRVENFMGARGRNYQRHISKPLLSRKSCSRMSPHLAWGNLSVRQVHGYVSEHPERKGSRTYASFLTRLRWNCHFIQKFEWNQSMSYEPRI